MKKIDLKSVLLGICVAMIGVLVLSSAPNEANTTLEFVSNPAGIGIYNRQSKALVLYKMWNGKLLEGPTQTFYVGDDGKSITEVK